MERREQVGGHPSPRARVRRVRLALLAAGFSTLVALTSHLAAGAQLPTLPGLLVPLLIALVAAVWLSPIRHSWFRLGGTVALSQFAFHTFFMLTTPVGAATAHAHHADSAELAGQIAAHLAAGEHTMHLAHDTPMMWAMHALAAVLTTVTLHYGEQILARLAAARRTVRAFFTVTLPHAAALPQARPKPMPRSAPSIPPLGTRPAAVTAHRGPPALA